MYVNACNYCVSKTLVTVCAYIFAIMIMMIMMIMITQYYHHYDDVVYMSGVDTLTLMFSSLFYTKNSEKKFWKKKILPPFRRLPSEIKFINCCRHQLVSHKRLRHTNANCLKTNKKKIFFFFFFCFNYFSKWEEEEKKKPRK